MTPDDDFDLGELARALDRAAPRPDPARRTADLALAQDVFDRMHGTARAAVPPRPTPAPAPRGRWTGLFAGWGAGGALTATTTVVAGALLVATPAGRDLLGDPFARNEAGSARPAPEGEAPDDAEMAAAPEAAAPPEPAPSLATGEAFSEPADAPRPEDATRIGAAESPPSPAPAEPPPDRATTLAEAAPPPAPAPQAPAVAAPPSPAPEVTAMAAPVPEDAPAAADAAPPVAAGSAPASDAARAAPLAEEAATAAAPEAESATEEGETTVAMAAPVPTVAAPSPAPRPEPVERDLGALAEGIVAAAPEVAGGGPDSPDAGLATLVAERAPARSVAEAPVAEVEPGPATGYWTELAATLRAGVLPPPATVRLGEILGAVPPSRGTETDGLGVTVLPAPWDPVRRIVLVSLPDGGAPGAEALRLRADWDEVASWRLLGAGATDGSGASRFLAAFEVTPLALGGGGTLGTLRLGGAAGDALRTAPIPADTPVAPEARFAAALAGWGLLLRGEDLGAWGPGEALALAQANRGKDGAPARDEALELLRIWEGLSR